MVLRRVMSAVVMAGLGVVLSAPVMAAPAEVSVDGYVSEAHCGAAHTAKSPNMACVKKCLAEGSAPVFVDDKTSSVWTIDNPDAVKGHYGHHIEATATVDADKKVVHITQVTMLADQGPKAGGMDMDHQ